MLNEEIRSEIEMQEVSEEIEEEDEVVRICGVCGEVIDNDDYEENVEVGDQDCEFVCRHCMDNLSYCEDCDRYYDPEYMRVVHGYSGDFWVCEDCLDNYYRCDDCDEYFDEDRIRSTHDGRWVCENCIDRCYSWCDNCEEYYPHDEVVYCEAHDEYVCENCHENCCECNQYGSDPEHKIYGYHEFSNWQDFRTDRDKNKFLTGFELEIEHRDDSRENQVEALDTIYDNLNAVCMHDGSLNESGIEIVSHPQSLEYILDHEQTYRDTFDKLVELGYRSHESEHCGLHFHVTRPENSEVVDRIWLIMETYKKELIAFSRRSSYNISRWAQFMSDVYENKNGRLKALKFYKDNQSAKNRTRYMALNNTNNRTIEFRIFRGTLNFDTFMASVELVNNIVELCSDLSIPIEEITWTRLTSTQYASKYVEEKNIKTNEVPRDYTLHLLEIEILQKKNEERIKKLIAELGRTCAMKTQNKRVITPDFNKTIDELNEYMREISDIRDIISKLSDIKNAYSYSDSSDRHDLIMSNVASLINYYRFDEKIKNKLKKILESEA